MEKYKLNPIVGDSFRRTSLIAKNIAKQNAVTVEFGFNGVKCLVDATTNLNLLHRDYSNSLVMGWKKIGTDCVKKYSTEMQLDLKKHKKLLKEKTKNNTK